MHTPLTWQLENDTPLRRWFGSRLPCLDNVPNSPSVGFRAVVPRRRPDALPPWLIGMAFDWRIRIGIEVPAEPRETTAHAGWRRVNDVPIGAAGLDHVSEVWEAPNPEGHNPISRLFDVALDAGGGGTDQRDELLLARVAVALARYEACYRGGVRHDDPLLSLSADPSVDALLALCPENAAREIARLTAAARGGLAPLFPADIIELNPDFTGHATPADGDLLIDGLLLDLKTITRSRLELDWLWQLLGYVLLDNGQRGIERVGLYFSRHAWLGTWPVDELVTALAGRPASVVEFREEFLSVIGRSA